jgi:hypothetical protein
VTKHANHTIYQCYQLSKLLIRHEIKIPFIEHDRISQKIASQFTISSLRIHLTMLKKELQLLVVQPFHFMYSNELHI